MLLSNGYHTIPSGKLANVQTFLEMRERPVLRASRESPGWRLARVNETDVDRYRALVHRVGDEYLWAARLSMTDSQLRDFLSHPRVEAYILMTERGDEGVLELDFRTEGECELTLFGIAAPLFNSGAGRWLMNSGIGIAWSHPIRRFWLHTCTLDHPNALAFYQRSGFRPFKRDVEIYDDPRVTGITRKDAAPHVPIL